MRTVEVKIREEGVIRTRWELVHPITRITLGFEWTERHMTEPMPPPPQFFTVPVIRLMVWQRHSSFSPPSWSGAGDPA